MNLTCSPLSIGSYCDLFLTYPIALESNEATLCRGHIILNYNIYYEKLK